MNLRRNKLMMMAQFLTMGVYGTTMITNNSRMKQKKKMGLMMMMINNDNLYVYQTFELMMIVFVYVCVYGVDSFMSNLLYLVCQRIFFLAKKCND